MWKPQALSDLPLSDHSWSTMRRTEEMWVSHHMFEISNSPSGDKMGKCESKGQNFEEIWGEALKNQKKKLGIHQSKVLHRARCPKFGKSLPGTKINMCL